MLRPGAVEFESIGFAITCTCLWICQHLDSLIKANPIMIRH